jgi:nucleoside-diphosphate-sugar epimerase
MNVDIAHKRVLITGGGGFIGYHIIKKLSEYNCDICIITLDGKTPSRLEEYNNITVKAANVSHYDEINACIDEYRPDFIFHLAAYGVNSADSEYHTAIDTNVIGIANVIFSAKASNCKKIINIGSCMEYGNTNEKMYEELCPHPVNIYGSTKAAASIIGHQLARELDIDMVTLRLFGVYGEGEERHKIFCHTISTLLEGNDLKLTPCTQYRDYCYVGDIANAAIMALQNDSIKNEIINIATGNALPLRDYIELIHKLMGSKNRLLFGSLPYRSTELFAPIADIKKAQKLLLWKPETSLEAGILKTIEWYKNLFGGKNID